MDNIDRKYIDEMYSYLTSNEIKTLDILKLQKIYTKFLLKKQRKEKLKKINESNL